MSKVLSLADVVFETGRGEHVGRLDGTVVARWINVIRALDRGFSEDDFLDPCDISIT